MTMRMLIIVMLIMLSRTWTNDKRFTWTSSFSTSLDLNLWEMGERDLRLISCMWLDQWPSVPSEIQHLLLMLVYFGSDLRTVLITWSIYCYKNITEERSLYHLASKERRALYHWQIGIDLYLFGHVQSSHNSQNKLWRGWKIEIERDVFRFTKAFIDIWFTSGFVSLAQKWNQYSNFKICMSLTKIGKYFIRTW